MIAGAQTKHTIVLADISPPFHQTVDVVLPLDFADENYIAFPCFGAPSSGTETASFIDGHSINKNVVTCSIVSGNSVGDVITVHVIAVRK